jgi:polysaccharide biosynthesis protein PslG
VHLPEDQRARTVVAIALAIAISVVASGCGASKPFGGYPGPPPRHTAFGFNEDITVAFYEQQAQLGMPIRRFPVAWKDVEPTPGRWSWGRSDAEYSAMRASGLEPLLVAIGAPCWAGSSEDSCREGALTGPQDPTHDIDWAEYVRRLTARYPDAVGVEVWNEPNIAPNWADNPDPTRYTALLKSAYSAVKGVNPEMPVISGGLFAAPKSGDFAMEDADFLAAVYAAGGRRYMDGIGAHPYPLDQSDPGSDFELEAMKDDLARLRSVESAAGDSNKPIWVTEVGLSTASAPGFPPGVSEDEQATDLRSIIHAVGTEGPIPVLLIHRLVDPAYPSSGDAFGQWESGFGVYAHDGHPKPAACALSREFRGSLSC